MAQGSEKFEIIVESKEALKQLEKVNKAIERTRIEIDKFNTLQINITTIERPNKKWYQFWK